MTPDRIATNMLLPCIVKYGRLVKQFLVCFKHFELCIPGLSLKSFQRLNVFSRCVLFIPQKYRACNMAHRVVNRRTQFNL